MTRVGLTSAAAVLAVTFGSAMSAQAPSTRGQGTTATMPPNASIQLTAQTEALTFISKMTVAGMAEVQLGKMAAEHAASPAVKAFGQMMVRDHTQAGNELTQIASHMNITPPLQLDQKHKDLADRLSKLQGAAFDREYIDAMVAGHQEVLSELQVRAGHRMTSLTPSDNAPATTALGASTGLSADAVGTAGTMPGEQALAQWVTKTLPTVQHHLDQARTLQQQLK